MQDLINLAVHLAMRFGKAVVIGAVMYYSLRVFNFSPGASFLAALVPVALGAMNIFTAKIFTIVAVVFIAATAVSLMKDKDIDLQSEDAKNIMQSVSVGVDSAVKSATQAASSIGGAAGTAAANAAAAAAVAASNPTVKAAANLPGLAATAAVNKATTVLSDKPQAAAPKAAASKPAAAASAPVAASTPATGTATK